MTHDSVATRPSRLQTWVSWLTIVSILGSSLALGANRPATWSLLSFLLIVLFLFQFFVVFPQRDIKKIRALLVLAVPFLGVVIWIFVQTMPGFPPTVHHPSWALLDSPGATISANPSGAGMIVMRLLCYAMIFWIAVRTCADRRTVLSILRAVALFSTALAAFGIFAYVTQYNPLLGADISNASLKAGFVNRNSYATFAVFGVLANMTAFELTSRAAVDAQSRLWRIRNFLERFFDGAWLYAFGTLLCLAAVALTQSRAGGIAAILGILVFLLSSKVKGQTRGWVMPGAMMVIGGFVALTSTSGFLERMLMTSEEELRFLVFPIIVDAIQERPFLGHGWGAFHEAFRPMVPLEGSFAEWNLAHNSYLENIFELGIPAATMFYGMLLLIVWRIWRGTVVRRRNREFCTFAFSCAVAAGFHSIFDFSLQIPAVAALFSFILGIGWGYSFPSSQQGRNKTP